MSHFRRRTLLVAALAALALLGASALDPRGVPRMRMLERQVAELRSKNVEDARRNQALEREIRALRGDPATIERVAREDLGYVRSDEILFRIQ
jgi:cell division protein FtsB